MREKRRRRGERDRRRIQGSTAQQTSSAAAAAEAGKEILLLLLLGQRETHSTHTRRWVPRQGRRRLPSKAKAQQVRLLLQSDFFTGERVYSIYLSIGRVFAARSLLLYSSPDRSSSWDLNALVVSQPASGCCCYYVYYSTTSSSSLPYGWFLDKRNDHHHRLIWAK